MGGSAASVCDAGRWHYVEALRLFACQGGCIREGWTVKGEYGGQSTVAPLRKALLRRPAWAPGTPEPWASKWGFEREPDLAAAQHEHDVFAQALRDLGVQIHYIDADAPGLYDLVFTYDGSLVTNQGAIILRSGKPARRGEQELFEQALKGLGIPILYRMQEPLTADGGDFMWLRKDLLLVGRSYRTNAWRSTGFLGVLSDIGVQIRSFSVPYWDGPGHVMHLMSLISLVDYDLAVAYRRLMPVDMVEFLEGEGIRFIDVGDDEFRGGLGANVLAVAPGMCVMLEGLDGVRRSLEQAGVEVTDYRGDELAGVMGGGPTCMTLPILRSR